MKIKNIIEKLNFFEVDRAIKSRSKSLNDIKNDESYFLTTQSWVDDIYTATIVSRNRYKIAFFSAICLAALLSICVLTLVPAQHTELVVVHEGQGGYTWLSTTQKDEKLATNWIRTQAEISHYVATREAYDPLMYRYQSGEVGLLSALDVVSDYDHSQASDNKTAPINLLGNKGYRTVTINSVLPLDSADKNKNAAEKHINLAQVNFVVTDHLVGQAQTTQTPYTALVSWDYRNPPSDPNKMLQNWDGFVITKYVVQPVNVTNTN